MSLNYVKFKERFDYFCKKYHITYKNIDLYVKAFSHNSYSNEHKIESNDDMGPLGTLILNTCLCRYLFDKKKTSSEQMKMKALFLDDMQKKKFCIEMGMHNMMFLSVAYDNMSIDEMPERLFNGCLYGLLVALWLESNDFNSCYKFLCDNYFSKLDIEGFSNNDYKSQLQEIIQSQKGQSIEYKTTEHIGTDNKPLFRVVLLINGKEMSRGEGNSKKQAGHDAAKKALVKMGKI